MARTKSLLFDDDVVEVFGRLGQNFTIVEFIAQWQRGEASADVTRRAISQAMASLVAVPVNEGGWSTSYMMQMLEKVVKENPQLYADIPTMPCPMCYGSGKRSNYKQDCLVCKGIGKVDRR